MEDIVARELKPMLQDLTAESEKRGLCLHFMTAREAYNIVRAAECGEAGDPDDYRDYELPPPVNRYFQPKTVVKILYCSPDSVAWESLEHQGS